MGRALGTGPVASFATEPIGTGQMSQSHRVSLVHRGRRARAASSSSSPSDDPTSRATGVGLGAYCREVRFYQELAARIGGSARPTATSPSTTRPRAGSRSCSRTSPRRARAIRSPAARVERGAGRADARSRGSTRRCSATSRSAATDWLNQPTPAQPGAASLAPAGIPRALRRPRRAASTPSSASASSRRRRVGRRPPPAARPRPRRLPARQPALRRDGSPRPHGRRLADRRLGPGDARRVLLHRRRRCRSRTGAPTRRTSCAPTTTGCAPQGVEGLSWETCWEEYRRQRLPRRPDGDRRRRWSSSAPTAATRCS